jgi:hypothetical protein
MMKTDFTPEAILVTGALRAHIHIRYGGCPDHLECTKMSQYRCKEKKLVDYMLAKNAQGRVRTLSRGSNCAQRGAGIGLPRLASSQFVSEQSFKIFYKIV